MNERCTYRIDKKMYNNAVDIQLHCDLIDALKHVACGSLTQGSLTSKQ